MIVMAIDPALENTGVVCYDDQKGEVVFMDTIRAKKGGGLDVGKGMDHLNRATYIVKALEGIVEEYSPMVICAEIPSGSQSASAAKALGVATGVIASLVGLSPAFVPISPTNVIKGTIGASARKGLTESQKKRVMIDWAEEKFPEVPWIRNKQGRIQSNQEHVADALAVLHAAYINNEGLKGVYYGEI